MILVDTSVWIDHLHKSDDNLVTWLDEGKVVTHPFVVQELACGTFKNRHDVVDMIDRLPKLKLISHIEFLNLIQIHRLFGKGLNAIDVHLLGAALIGHAKLASHDKALQKFAKGLGL